MYHSVPLVVDADNTVEGDGVPPQSSELTFVAVQTDGTSATVLIQGSPDNTNWFTIKTLTLANDVKAETYTGKWNYIRGKVSAFSGGQDALVNVYMMQ
jgi:hypothetical protein